MVWSILSVAACIYTAICLIFFFFQRSFIYMPTPVAPAHAAAITLEAPGATLRVSCHPMEGTKALVYFGGNAEDVAYTLPELAEKFPDRVIYVLHYRGYSAGRGTAASNISPAFVGWRSSRLDSSATMRSTRVDSMADHTSLMPGRLA
jgi:hypothetical protein